VTIQAAPGLPQRFAESTLPAIREIPIADDTTNMTSAFQASSTITLWARFALARTFAHGSSPGFWFRSIGKPASAHSASIRFVKTMTAECKKAGAR
jgi:hypothetical protein